MNPKRKFILALREGKNGSIAKLTNLIAFKVTPNIVANLSLSYLRFLILNNLSDPIEMASKAFSSKRY